MNRFQVNMMMPIKQTTQAGGRRADPSIIAGKLGHLGLAFIVQMKMMPTLYITQPRPGDQRVLTLSALTTAARLGAPRSCIHHPRKKTMPTKKNDPA